MRIVLVHNSYQLPGGEDSVYRNERDLLTRRGHEVIEYRRSNDEVSRFVSPLALAKNTIWASDTRTEFRNLLLREKPDVVHVHNTFVRISPSIYWACRDAGVPVVQTLHNYRLLCPGANLFREGRVCEECIASGVWRGVRNACYRESRAATAVVAVMLATHRVLGTWSRLIDLYLVPTEFARRKFIAGGLPAEKIVVKPNFVDPDPGFGNGERTFALFVGRLSAEKGLHTLLNAWRLLPLPIPLKIIGDGPMRGELEDFVRRNQLSSVSFLGAQPWDQAMAAMKQARCLVFPSECYEGALPLTVVEAFACGAPVISSRLGAMQDLIVDDNTGIHFNPSDAQDLADKLARVWANRDELAGISHRARRQYETHYTAASSYEALLKTYRRCIDKAATNTAPILTSSVNPVAERWTSRERRI